MSKTYLEMTDKEIASKARLSTTERAAVDAFIEAAKSLPRNICIETASWSDEDEHLTVSKRITKGSARQVASLRKKSLIF